MAKRKSNPVQRQGECQSCGTRFTYTYTMGCPRRHCGDKCRSRHARDLKAAREKSLPSCSAPGCDGLATRVLSGLCEKHYTRKRRNGDISDRPAPKPRLQSHGYVIERRDHPLSVKGGVYQHRRVAYDVHGGDCPCCYWCGESTSWGKCHIDHLNGVKDDNRPDNLVVSCPRCNRARGAAWPFLLALTEDGLQSLIDLLNDHRRKQEQRAAGSPGSA